MPGKERHPDKWDRLIEPYNPYGPGKSDEETVTDNGDLLPITAAHAENKPQSPHDQCYRSRPRSLHIRDSGMECKCREEMFMQLNVPHVKNAPASAPTST